MFSIKLHQDMIDLVSVNFRKFPVRPSILYISINHCIIKLLIFKFLTNQEVVTRNMNFHIPLQRTNVIQFFSEKSLMISFDLITQ